MAFLQSTLLLGAYVTREAITKDQMRKFLKFVHDDVVYCKYYEVVYILFHTGMRISEFCGLTLKDIDLENRTINIDHQLQRTSDMRYIIETTYKDGCRNKSIANHRGCGTDVSGNHRGQKCTESGEIHRRI